MALFSFILLMVIVFQFFDAIENAGYIEENSLEKKFVGWGLLALQILAALESSKYLRKEVRSQLPDWERRKQDITIIIILAVFLTILVVLNLIDLGSWIFNVMF